MSCILFWLRSSLELLCNSHLMNEIRLSLHYELPCKVLVLLPGGVLISYRLITLLGMLGLILVLRI